jgi:alkylation response protein AidB-like acyl-CoA dehydrogenase
VDTRDTPEQAELRRAARQLARDLGPATVADLEDATRTKRLAEAVRDAGWLELRHDRGDGEPLASGVEVAIIADALGGAVADVAFAGPMLAGELARGTGTTPTDNAAVAFSSSLIDAAVVPGPATAAPLYAVDSPTEHVDAYVLVPAALGYRLARVTTDGAGDGADLTRGVRQIPAGSPVVEVSGQRSVLTRDELAQWTALALALTSADLVGLMRGLLDVTVEYAAARRQFGAPIGSFQAVQHLLAEGRCLMEASFSVALHASWAVDNLGPDEACVAGRVAKAYCARAARTVCETAVQVHGGIGNTWECIVHVYLRRALLSSRWFGDDGEQLDQLQRERLGTT